MSQRVIESQLGPDTRRPYVELAVEFFNGGMHTVVVGPVDGRATFNGDELEDEAEATSRSRIVRHDSSVYRVRVPLRPEDAEAIYQEIQPAENGVFAVLRSINLHPVNIYVESEPEDGNASNKLAIRITNKDDFIVG